MSRFASWVKDFKEIIAGLLFVGGGLIWVANYFATRENLDELDCFTKVNVRLLQAGSNVTFNKQQIKDSRAELRTTQRALTKDKAGEGTVDDVSMLQNRTDELTQQIESFQKTLERETKSSERAFTALTNSSCRNKDIRAKIIDQIDRSEF